MQAVTTFEPPPPPAAPPSTATRGADASRALLDGLRATGAERDAAIASLHGLLLRAARFEVGRRASPAGLDPLEVEDLAHQAADDALVAVLRKLDDYRGESRFTTWAYKFALLEASVRVRRRAWAGREVALDEASWAASASPDAGPAARAEEGELLAAVRGLIESELTPRQRAVLVALAIDGVPIDVLAERLSTTRGALYKTLHDARRKLRAALAASGHEIGSDGG